MHMSRHSSARARCKVRVSPRALYVLLRSCFAAHVVMCVDREVRGGPVSA